MHMSAAGAPNKLAEVPGSAVQFKDHLQQQQQQHLAVNVLDSLPGEHLYILLQQPYRNMPFRH
jgi:hypothetical protein